MRKDTEGQNKNATAKQVAFTHSIQMQTKRGERKMILDNLHLLKIDRSYSIFVINVDGYIGKSTKREIEYAKKKGKQIKYYSKEVSADSSHN